MEVYIYTIFGSDYYVPLYYYGGAYDTCNICTIIFIIRTHDGLNNRVVRHVYSYLVPITMFHLDGTFWPTTMVFLADGLLSTNYVRTPMSLECRPYYMFPNTFRFVRNRPDGVTTKMSLEYRLCFTLLILYFSI